MNGEHAFGAPWARRWSASIVAAVLLLVATACAVALWIVDMQGERLIASAERDAVASEIDLLSEVRREEGDAVLIRELGRRARLNPEYRIYALRDGGGHVLASTIGEWPVGVGGRMDWISITGLAGHQRAHVTTRTFEDGAMLLVGHDDSVLSEFRAGVLDAAWIAIAVVAMTCLVLAAAITSYLMQRVRRLSDVAARVSAGDFSARAAGANDGGPFGEIAKAQNAMLDRIDNLVTSLRTVTDSLAHDLRTPLARTRRVLEQGVIARSPAAKEAALEKALEETDRTLTTFSALVDIARADSGLSRDSMNHVDLAQLARDTYDLFEPLAAERQQTIDLSIVPARALAHKPLLMQAVSNLLHNAIKYAPQGGRITFRLRTQTGAAEFEVADNGPGIPADRRADAVQRFKRLATNAGDPEGAGLGLAIVEACARLHGGQLLLEDNHPGLRARLVLKLEA